MANKAAQESPDGDDDDDAQGDALLPGEPTSRSRLSSFASDDSGTATKALNFQNDAIQGLLDTLRDDDMDSFDSAKLEFMGLRLASDASDSSLRRAVAAAFARRTAELTAPEHGGLEPTKAADAALNSKKGAADFVREVGVGGDGIIGRRVTLWRSDDDGAGPVAEGIVGFN